MTRVRTGLAQWSAIGALLLATMVIHGTVNSGLPVFDKALLEALHITRGALKFREALFYTFSGLSGLAIGFLALKVQPRWIVLGGLLLLAATLLAYSYAQTIGQIYFLYPLLGMSFASAHVVIVVLIVRERFTVRRAIATAVALSGTSLGAAIYPAIVTRIMEHTDWRHAMRLLALAPLIALPFTILLLRIKSLPAALPLPEAVGTVASATRRTPLRLALLLIATFGVFFASSSYVMNLFLFLGDSGFSARQASMGLSLFFAIGLVGKALVGLAAERWGSSIVWIAVQALLLAGAIVLTGGQGGALFVGLVLLSLGWAGCYVLTQVVVADYFAGPSLSRRMGMFIVFEAIAAGSGVWLAGTIFDWLGSYRAAFAGNGVLIAISLVASILFLRPANSARGRAQGTVLA